jgi:hypothetical protein
LLRVLTAGVSTHKRITKVACPTCGLAVTWSEEQRWRPFCSERCKLIDLGEWLDEGHRISDPEQTLDLAPHAIDEDSDWR